MTHIITEACIGVKDTACVDVCPVECIHPMKGDKRFGDADQLYIDPDECIDCGACVSECPVEAIFFEEDLPPKFSPAMKKNREYFKRVAP